MMKESALDYVYKYSKKGNFGNDKMLGSEAEERISYVLKNHYNINVIGHDNGYTGRFDINTDRFGKIEIKNEVYSAFGNKIILGSGTGNHAVELGRIRKSFVISNKREKVIDAVIDNKIKVKPSALTISTSNYYIIHIHLLCGKICCAFISRIDLQNLSKFSAHATTVSTVTDEHEGTVSVINLVKIEEIIKKSEVVDCSILNTKFKDILYIKNKDEALESLQYKEKRVNLSYRKQIYMPKRELDGHHNRIIVNGVLNRDIA